MSFTVPFTNIWTLQSLTHFLFLFFSSVFPLAWRGSGAVGQRGGVAVWPDDAEGCGWTAWRSLFQVAGEGRGGARLGCPFFLQWRQPPFLFSLLLLPLPSIRRPQRISNRFIISTASPRQPAAPPPLTRYSSSPCRALDDRLRPPLPPTRARRRP